MIPVSSKRTLAMAAACVTSLLGTTGCASLVGTALDIAAAEASQSSRTRANPGSAGPIGRASPLGGTASAEGNGATTSVYLRGPTPGWERTPHGDLNNAHANRLTAPMGPTPSPSCGASPFGLARSAIRSGGIPSGLTHGPGPLQQAQAMTISITTPYYSPVGFSVLGDELITASAAATDPRCGLSVFAYLRLNVIPWGARGAPVHQFR